jgi:hypothetical protein
MFPQVEPYEAGLLDVADTSLYWEQSITPARRSAASRPR